MSDDDVFYSLTPWGCMREILRDYDVDIDHLTPKMSEHMVEDFMDLMCKQGHVKFKRDGKTCKTCKWHDSFSWVCFNGDSEHCADFIDADKSCGEWERKQCTE